jgi:hypothetical protein
MLIASTIRSPFQSTQTTHASTCITDVTYSKGIGHKLLKTISTYAFCEKGMNWYNIEAEHPGINMIYSGGVDLEFLGI